MSDHTSQPARQTGYDPDDDDEWYDESWAPVVDLIEDGEWPSDQELARRLSKGWLIPEIVRQVLADRIERKDPRPRGQPKRAMSPTLVFARIAFRRLRIQIRAARRGGASASVFAKELGQERGTPKDLALDDVAGQFDMDPETLRYWYYSAPERGRKIQKRDLSCDPLSPPVDWEVVRSRIQTRHGVYRTRLTQTVRKSLADAVRRDPNLPEDIVRFLRSLLRGSRID